MTETTHDTSILTPEELVEGARSLIPTLRERQSLADSQRKLPQETPLMTALMLQLPHLRNL